MRRWIFAAYSISTLWMAAALVNGSAWALPPIPSESGFRGGVRVAMNVTDAETNLVKGIPLGELGKENVTSVNRAPKSNDDVFLSPAASLSYTFADQQLQLFLTGGPERLVTLETLQELGVRKQFETLGVFSLGYVTSGIVPQEVWEDPYDASAARDDTDQQFGGARFVWDKILGSPIEVLFQWRDMDIDRELSGAALVSAGTITPTQAALLERDGDDYRAELRYTWQQSRRTVLTPYVGYTSADRDGDAVKNEGPYLGLDVAYFGGPIRVLGRLRGGSRDYDARNPVYGERTDTDWYEFALNATLALPFGNGRWSAVGGIAYAEDDSDVSFHDQKILLFQLGARYALGKITRRGPPPGVRPGGASGRP